LAHGLTISAVIEAARKGNNDIGGLLVELSGREYMVRGRGYVKSTKDLESMVLKAVEGTTVTVGDVATVTLGPELRRGIADLDGKGDVVGSIVVMRVGENALNVIDRVKARLEELKPSLPDGVEVTTTYDRSELIERAIETVKGKLIEEMIVVSIIILIFLWHIPSAIIPIVTIPVSVALAFIPMRAMGLNANLMSLAGIAISIGVLVDGAIVEVENAYNKLHLWDAGGRKGDFHEVRLHALLDVGPSVFFSLLVIAVAFTPVFTLVDQEGRLFRPLAYSKNLAMAIAAILAITLDPAMRMLFTRMDPFKFKPRWLAWISNQVLVGKHYAEERHPISGFLHHIYEPPCRFVLRHPKATLGAALAVGEHAAREGAAQAHPSNHARAHLWAPLYEHQIGLQGVAGDAGGPVLGHRRRLAAVCAQLRRLDRRLGWDDCADGAGCRDRGVHALVPRSFARRGQGSRAAEDAGRLGRGDHSRRSEASAAEGNDRHGRLHGFAADHVVDRHRRGRDEADRGADGGRPGDVVHPRIARLSGRLLSLAATRGGAEGPITVMPLVGAPAAVSL